MFGALLLAAGLAAHAVPEPPKENPFIEVCREAHEWSSIIAQGALTTPQEEELAGQAYIGRMKIATDKHGLYGKDAELAEHLCEIYLAGAADTMKWIGEEIHNLPNKQVAQR